MLIEKLKNIQGDRRDFRKFGLTVGAALVALGAYFWWREKSFAPHFIYGGAVIFILGALIPNFLRPLYRAWMFLGELFGSVVTFLISCIAFYLIVTPLALVGRLTGKKFIHRAPDEKLRSYWEAKNDVTLGKDWGKQF